MGKRSNFERREADFYPTPRAAVLPLIPHLRGIHTFAEPCAGDGALVRHLESFGLRCVYRRRHPHRPGCACARPLRRGRCDHHQSALDARRDACADRALPEHCADVAAVRRGLDGDQAGGAVPAPLLGHRDDRPREMDSRDRSTPARTTSLGTGSISEHSRGPVFHRRDQGEAIPSRRTRVCEQCGKRYEPQRSSSRFCSPACRQRAHRKRLSVTSSVTTPRLNHRLLGSVSLRPARRRSEVRGGRLGAVACARWHTPR